MYVYNVMYDYTILCYDIVASLGDDVPLQAQKLQAPLGRLPQEPP